MRYDHNGFPIPPRFESASDVDCGNPSTGRPPLNRASSGKRVAVLALLFGVFLPLVVLPGMMPMVRDAVVRWSLDRALAREGRGDFAAAAAEVDRALAWIADDGDARARMLCWRATLLLEGGASAAALDAAHDAVAVAPNASHAHRTRAIVHVVAGRPDEALTDAHTAVALAGDRNPEALNHRAYIRALVGRELPEALADIEEALAGGDAESPEFLDTRGFVLHLIGRHREAIDDLNRAIGATVRRRRELASQAGWSEADEMACRIRAIDHALAVMHQHRALACRAAGMERQAVQDFDTARAKGFAPERGVL